MLETILAPLGEPLIRASSGAEAALRAAQEDFALILLDLQMSELDGLETAALLKKAERSRAVPIIITTAAVPTHAMVAKGYASGAVDFVYKPFDAELLRSKVRVFVDRYKRVFMERSEAGAVPSEITSGRLSERLIRAGSHSAHAETVKALVRIHGALTEGLDRSRIAQRLVDETTALSSARGGAFHYPAAPPGGEHATMDVAFSGAMKSELRQLGPHCALLHRVFREGSPLRIVTVEQAPCLREVVASVRSMLAVPVLSRTGEVAGAIVLVHDEPEVFDARHEELAAVAASHAAASLENARLYDEATEARRRAELAEIDLRAGEARRRLALESAGLGTWEYNPLSQSLRWDARAKALSGLPSRADVDMRTWLSAVHDADRARVESAIHRALNVADSGLFDCEYRTVGIGDGVERWVASRGQAIVERGRVVRFIGTFLDITDKKRTEDELARLLSREQEARAESETARARAEAASRAKDEFLATVSHELRNPLNAILGWSRVLLEGGDDIPRERLRKGLDVVARNARAQVQLVEDILDVSRIVSGKLRLSTDRVDVRTAVEACLDTVRSAAQAKGVLLEARFAGDPGMMVADEDRIQQILWNLASNAVKFTPHGGVVRVAARREANVMVLAVSDTGGGIDPEFLPFVFDRFRQADGSTTRTHGGLGLGLAIVRLLVELHGGVVTAESGGIGCGATFTVRLPLFASTEVDEDPAGHPPVHSVPERSITRESPLSGLRILVVDDEEDLRDLVTMILENAGAKVARARSVATALRELQTAVFDLVVSDLAMPGEDGYVLVGKVRGSLDERIRNLPLVAMTAYARAEDRHRVLAAGFQRHIAKPIEPKHLVMVLQELTRELALSAPSSGPVSQAAVRPAS